VIGIAPGSVASKHPICLIERRNAMETHTQSQEALQELDVDSLRQVQGGYLGPDQSVSDFPVWALPYINIARIGQIAQGVGMTGH
jgi:hypothetical protein